MLKDAVHLNSTREITPEGYLLAKVALTRVGVQQYLLSDMTGDDADQGKFVGVYRPSSTVFHEETANSARMKPVTLNHPSGLVGVDNYRQLALGHLGDTVEALDTKRLGANILLTDADLVKKVMNNELKEVSMGYSASIVPEEGNFEEVDYQYRFDGPMIINHLAVVPDGRCGESVAILDKKTQETDQEKGEAKMSNQQDVNEAIKVLVDQVATLETHNTELQKAVDTLTATIARFKKDMQGKKGQKDKKEQKDEPLEEDGKKACDEDDPNEEEGEATNQPSEDKSFKNGMNQSFDAKVKDAVQLRVDLLEKAKPYLKDASAKSNREILVEACKNLVDQADKKSDEYLMGVLDSVAKNRSAAQQNLKDFASQRTEGAGAEARLFEAHEIKKLQTKEKEKK